MMSYSNEMCAPASPVRWGAADPADSEVLGLQDVRPSLASESRKPCAWRLALLVALAFTFLLVALAFTFWLWGSADPGPKSTRSTLFGQQEGTAGSVVVNTCSQRCQNGGRCSTATGLCVCLGGIEGELCERKQPVPDEVSVATVALTIDISVYDEDRDRFTRTFATVMAETLGTTSDRIAVVSVTAGSVQVEFYVVPSTGKRDVSSADAIKRLTDPNRASLRQEVWAGAGLGTMTISKLEPPHSTQPGGPTPSPEPEPGNIMPVQPAAQPTPEPEPMPLLMQPPPPPPPSRSPPPPPVPPSRPSPEPEPQIPAEAESRCRRINFAAQQNGGTATASHLQGGYHVKESNDGRLAPASNGWAFSGGASASSPRTAIYSFDGVRTIDTVEVLSGISRRDHQLTDFRLWATTDAQPSMSASTKWSALRDLHFLTGTSTGSIVGNRVRVQGQHSVSLAYAAVGATGLRIDVLGTSARNGNVVLTEMSVLGMLDTINRKTQGSCLSSACPRQNVALASLGGNASASHEQPGQRFSVEESINGVTSTNADGWAPGASASRSALKVATYTLAARSVIDTIEIISGIGRGDHMVTGARLYFTNSSSKANLADPSTHWRKLTRIRALDPVAGLAVSENEVMAKGQHYMRLTFDPVMATGVRLELFRTNAGNGNAVLTELMVVGHNVVCS